MNSSRAGRLMGLALIGLTLAGCGGRSFLGFGGNAREANPDLYATRELREASGTTLSSLFRNDKNANVTVNVNKYIWNASLDVLNFLPVESVDPFTGVIVTGYGTPPGGGRSYRATVYVQDPALDARSLRVALQARGGGPVNAETARAVEDAILTRARQMRVADGRL